MKTKTVNSEAKRTFIIYGCRFLLFYSKRWKLHKNFFRKCCQMYKFVLFSGSSFSYFHWVWKQKQNPNHLGRDALQVFVFWKHSFLFSPVYYTAYLHFCLWKQQLFQLFVIHLLSIVFSLFEADSYTLLILMFVLPTTVLTRCSFLEKLISRDQHG